MKNLSLRLRNTPVRQRSHGTLRYEIDGLPYGQQGWIADAGDHWEILRRINGHQTNSSGDYRTAEQALAIVKKCFAD
jgi:hypothetical protein